MIEVRNLTKLYPGRAAVTDLSFSVPRGQVLGFLGPNGAGKSTTMRILTGFIAPTEGSAAVAGHDVLRDSLAVRRRVGYLPENNPLYGEMRVDGYLLTMAALRGVPRRLRPERLDYALESCGLSERRHEVIGRLSRGLRQRVGLAQAVVHDPDVLILDEPTAGLDPGQTHETRALITDLGRQHTVVLSTHILPEVSATCDRVLIINQGRLVADDTTVNLGRNPRRDALELVVRGDPAAVRERLAKVRGVERVSVTAVDGEECVVEVDTGGEDLREAVARALVSSRFGLRGLRPLKVSLEEVFLELTREEPQ